MNTLQKYRLIKLASFTPLTTGLATAGLTGLGSLALQDDYVDDVGPDGKPIKRKKSFSEKLLSALGHSAIGGAVGAGAKGLYDYFKAPTMTSQELRDDARNRVAGVTGKDPGAPIFEQPSMKRPDYISDTPENLKQRAQDKIDAATKAKAESDALAAKQQAEIDARTVKTTADNSPTSKPSQGSDKKLKDVTKQYDKNQAAADKSTAKLESLVGGNLAGIPNAEGIKSDGFTLDRTGSLRTDKGGNITNKDKVNIENALINKLYGIGKPGLTRPISNSILAGLDLEGNNQVESNVQALRNNAIINATTPKLPSKSVLQSIIEPQQDKQGPTIPYSSLKNILGL